MQEKEKSTNAENALVNTDNSDDVHPDIGFFSDAFVCINDLVYYTTSHSTYGPSLCPGSGLRGMLLRGTLVVGRTPYLPYVFWSTLT